MKKAIEQAINCLEELGLKVSTLSFMKDGMTGAVQIVDGVLTAGTETVKLGNTTRGRIHRMVEKALAGRLITFRLDGWEEMGWHFQLNEEQAMEVLAMDDERDMATFIRTTGTGIQPCHADVTLNEHGGGDVEEILGWLSEALESDDED